MKHALTLALALLVSGHAAASAKTYSIDSSHTNVIATWDHNGYSKPSAAFSQVAGAIRYDESAIEQSSVDVTLPLSGMTSFVPALDDHLRGEHFFDAAKFPSITFVSTSVKRAGGSALEIVGMLTIKGIAKEVVLHATLNKAGVSKRSGAALLGFDATTTIKRTDFGMGMAVPAVSDEIVIRITTEASAAQ